MRIGNELRMNNFEKEHYVCPKKARQKWNMAKRGNRFLYINGMTGFGKTAFINCMLNRKADIYISADKISLEDLIIEESGRDRTVIIDDIDCLYDISEDNKLVSAIIELINREDIWVVISGRCHIPQWLSECAVFNNVVTIREEELALTYTDCVLFFSKWDIKLSEEEIRKLHSVYRGNGLGLKFVALHLEAGEKIDEKLFLNVSDEICRYASEVIYDKWNYSDLETVAHLAVVEEFDFHAIRILTGEENARELIEKYQRRGNFIEEHFSEAKGYFVYSIRPFVRQTLLYYLGTKKIMSGNEILALYQKAGEYYEQKEQYVKALRYFRISGSDEDIASVLISNSKKNPGNGQYCELRRYYTDLPREIVLKSPDLMYALSMVNSMVLNTDESDKWYDELKKYARSHNGKEEKNAKILLDYLDIALPHRGSKDLIKLLTKLGNVVASGGMQRSDFSITSNLPSQMNGGKDFCSWSKNDVKMAKSFGSIIGTALGTGGKALVNLALAESFFEKGINENQIIQYIQEGRMQAEAVDRLDQIFVADALMVWKAIINGNSDEAERILGSFIKRAEEAEAERIVLNARALNARLNLYCDNRADVMRWFDNCPNEDHEFVVLDRLKYLTKIRVYIMLERYDEAKALLIRMLYYSKVDKRVYIEAECSLLMAIVKYRTKDDSWSDDFDKCLKFAREYGFVRIISREGEAARRLVAELPEGDDFYRRVKKETNDVAKKYPLYLSGINNDVSIEGNALKILQMQAEGFSNIEIAAKLDINADTVKYHNKQNYKKLGVNNKTAAVVEAEKRGLL